MKHFFQYSETTFSKKFCPNFFLMFCVLSSKMNTKKLLKTKHQCKTSVKLALTKLFFESKFMAKLL